MPLHVLSAGAAKGLLSRVEVGFCAAAHTTIDGIYSAVGAIEERFRSNEPCDLLILTAEQMAGLTASGLIRAETAVALGSVPTSVAVPVGQSSPTIATREQLKAALVGASALYVPDLARSTAGRHVRRMLDALAITDALGIKVREFANGETAMRALAQDALPGALGCTQITEIMNTPGLTPVGPLPPPFQLATVYTAGVPVAARQADLAHRLVAELGSAANASLRARCGFEPLV